MDETGRLVAVVLLASFAIERVVAVVDFFMDPPNADERRRKIVLVGIAGLIGLAVVWLTGVRILGAMKFAAPNPWIDVFLTWMILVGGANKLGQLLGGQKSPFPKPSQEVRPIQVFLDRKDITPDVVPPQ